MVTIALARPLPSIVRIGQTVAVTGRITPPRAAAEVALELERPGGNAHPSSSVVARARARRGSAFSLRWVIASGADDGPVSLRVVATVKHRQIAVTTTVSSAIGPAAVKCAAPVPPAVSIPVGDGWIQGGNYIEGGPFPGVDECESQSYTITATSTTTNAVFGPMTVAGGQSYTIVVPAGTYTLTGGSDGFCRSDGTVTVSAGQATLADTECPVP